MEEVVEVPARYFAELLCAVVLAKQLHPHDREDEDDDKEDKTEVAQCTHRPSDDAN